MVRPYSMRDWPTAKSAMSIISCTSPSPSAWILPFSSVTSVPRSFLCVRSSSPTSRTASPRFGAGTVRHAAAVSTARLHHVLVVRGTGAAHLREQLAVGRD